jgi:hypothetical protein
MTPIKGKIQIFLPSLTRVIIFILDANANAKVKSKRKKSQAKGRDVNDVVSYSLRSFSYFEYYQSPLIFIIIPFFAISITNRQQQKRSNSWFEIAI